MCDNTGTWYSRYSVSETHSIINHGACDRLAASGACQSDSLSRSGQSGEEVRDNGMKCRICRDPLIRFAEDAMERVATEFGRSAKPLFFWIIQGFAGSPAARLRWSVRSTSAAVLSARGVGRGGDVRRYRAVAVKPPGHEKHRQIPIEPAAPSVFDPRDFAPCRFLDAGLDYECSS